MSTARGNNNVGSSNVYEQERLDNIKRIKKRMTELNIPEIIKDLDQQVHPRKASKKKHSTSASASKPDLQPSKPNLRPRPKKDNVQREEEVVPADVQPVGDFLTDNVEDIQNDNTTKKATRGITKMDEIFSRAPQMSKIKIALNKRGQPIGDGARKFSSALGCYVRKKLSIAYKDWRLIDIEKKLELWTDMKQYYDIDDAALNWFLRSAHMKWKQFKSETKDKYFNPDFTLEEIPECPDERINKEDWQSVYNYWLSSEFEDRSEIAKANRQHMQLHHTAGSVSFACLEHDLAVELGRPPRRDDVFVKSHTKKNGVPAQPAENMINQIKDILEIYPEIKNRTIQEGDAFAIICGEKESKGRVRCLGLGPTPQDIGTPMMKSYKSTRLQMEMFTRKKAQNEKAALEQRVSQLQAEIEQRAEKDRASEEPASHHGSTTHPRQFFSAMNDEDDHNQKDYASGAEDDHMF